MEKVNVDGWYAFTFVYGYDIIVYSGNWKRIYFYSDWSLKYYSH